MTNENDPYTPTFQRTIPRMVAKPGGHRHVVTAKQKNLGSSIRAARRAANLTQTALGKRLGIEGRAVHRWEVNKSAPSRRREAEMVAVIRTYHAEAATALQTALQMARSKQVHPVALAVPAQPEPTPPPISAADAFEHSVYALADALDLSPRRVRRPLLRLLERLLAAGFTVESAKHQLENWIGESAD